MALLAFRFTLMLEAFLLLGCQSSHEKARNEMEPAYRSAKLLREQVKAGVTLAEFNRLRGNFAAELSILGDRMQAQPRIGRLLQSYFPAYSSALDAYSLVGSVWEYHTTMDACAGPEPSPEFKNAQSAKELLADKSASEGLYILNAEGASLARWAKCFEDGENTRKALDQRSKQLNTQCPLGVDSHLDCVIKDAERKLTTADQLLMRR